MKFSAILATVMTFALVVTAMPAPQASGFADTLRKDGPVGGNGGTAFDDADELVAKATGRFDITSIAFCTDDRISKVTLKVDLGFDERFFMTHGSGSGDESSCTGGLGLAKDEVINRVTISVTEGRVSRILASCNTDREFFETGIPPLFQSFKGTPTTFDAPQGFRLVGFHGRAGRQIDALGPIWGPITV